MLDVYATLPSCSTTAARYLFGKKKDFTAAMSCGLFWIDGRWLTWKNIVENLLFLIGYIQ
jgi:hypothetical protein